MVTDGKSKIIIKHHTQRGYKLQIGFYWLRIESSAGLYWALYKKTSGFYKRMGNLVNNESHFTYFITDYCNKGRFYLFNGAIPD